ncbi:hypothetical protein [Ideonella sp.]|uniref:hypothetical protein n=1 Tax=Ideonella sp. TaxID=1929293 RepID=UPI0035B3D216
MNLVALPAFADNYRWMLHAGPQAFVADPDDAASALDAPGRLAMQGILVTQPPCDQAGRPGRTAPHDAAGSRRLRNLPTSP